MKRESPHRERITTVLIFTTSAIQRNDVERDSSMGGASDGVAKGEAGSWFTNTVSFRAQKKTPSARSFRLTSKGNEICAHRRRDSHRRAFGRYKVQYYRKCISMANSGEMIEREGRRPRSCSLRVSMYDPDRFVSRTRFPWPKPKPSPMAIVRQSSLRFVL